MCGIVGGRGTAVVDCIDQMVNLMAHRGPDHSAHWSSKDIALGHARLSIIDTGSGSNQPFWDETGRYCLVYNGEIYNYNSIKEQLVSKGIKFRSKGDTEVLLQALIHFGTNILSELEGIFAFCLFDQSDGSLLLSRDKFGVKPLYYYADNTQFMFASEYKSFLANPDFITDVNFDTLFRTLLFMYNPGNETAFAHVNKVPAGCYILHKANSDTVEINSYWEWPKYDPVKNQSHVENIQKHLKTAVQRQMVSDVPVGAFLSGGVDSSVICKLAKGLESEHPFSTFTIKTDFDANDGFEDDLPYAKKVAEFLGVELKILDAKPSIIELLQKTVYHLDDIHADPAAINVLLICELAQKSNYKVLLSGSGGDDLFTGYRRHQAIYFERYWIWLPVQIRHILKKLTSHLPVTSSINRRIRKLFQYADFPTKERLLSYHFWSDPNDVKALFRQSEKLSERPIQFILDEMSLVETSDTIELALFLERSYFLKDHNFAYTDKLSMATGVEVRVPFLDTNLVGAAAKVPSSQKQRGRVGKFILKKVAELYLPHSIIYRPKTGFGAPLRKWLRGDLASYLDDKLSKETITKRGIFDYHAVKKLIEDDRNSMQDNSYTLYALICIELWFQTFIDGRDNFVNKV
ncbi:asparagine synthase (glutamine-hydrolyzing) [Planktomarina sp.]|nr:asparagine synthase (glutamine-hydrolyzing) [Planktomarina sp.]